jgi:membrane protease YdiL (CAAX protease family)
VGAGAVIWPISPESPSHQKAHLTRKEEIMTGKIAAILHTLVKRRPLISYFALTFAISWGAMLLVIGGVGGLSGTPAQIVGLFPLVVMALMAGPSVSGILMNALVDGKAGLRDLLDRLLRWRVGARWYAVALLTAPLLATVIFAGLSLLSPEFVPTIVTTSDKAALLLLALVTGVTGGFLEELGWTGFAIPAMKRARSVFATGLIVGVLWGAWHFLVNLWYSPVIAGEVPFALFVPLYFLTGVAQLTAYRVLMVWVYDHTESLLIAILMHAALIDATTPMLIPATVGVAFLTWFFAFTLLLWAIVGLVAMFNLAMFNRGHVAQKPLQTPAA